MLNRQWTKVNTLQPLLVSRLTTTFAQLAKRVKKKWKTAMSMVITFGLVEGIDVKQAMDKSEQKKMLKNSEFSWYFNSGPFDL